MGEWGRGRIVRVRLRKHGQIEEARK